jgi:Protein of unknown function (DUF3182)
MLGCRDGVRMDGIRLSPPTSGQLYRSTADQIARDLAIDTVVVYFSQLGAPMYTHERIALSEVAESIARIKGCRFAGVCAATEHLARNPFFVPDDTLMLDEARALGIHSPHQLYGAVAPYSFVKTKAITYRLVSGHAARPHGWSSAFADEVRRAVLPGYTAFSRDDARTAARRLLPLGPIRVKDPLGDGGHGQTVAAGLAEVDALLETFSPVKIASHGLVLETNLRQVTTRSVGQTIIGDRMIAYHGAQRSITNNHGLSVYGGSHLVCVRGGWAELQNLPMDADARLAVNQARAYDHAARLYSGFLASRRNYDVGQGIDQRGQWRSGVFEASWRSGGASTAEVAALMAFEDDPTLQVVEATSVKQFGQLRKPPPGALVHFQGDDPDEGPLVRYTVVNRALRHVA